MGVNARAIILLAHGSRDPQWRQPMEAVAKRMRVLEPGTAVQCAYLELAQPGLAECAAQLIAEGARRINIAPMFLGMGKHVREDLPRLVEQLRLNHAEVSFQLQHAAGEDPRMIELLAEIALHR